jgi:hypothetical protein
MVRQANPEPFQISHVQARLRFTYGAADVVLIRVRGYQKGGTAKPRRGADPSFHVLTKCTSSHDRRRSSPLPVDHPIISGPERYANRLTKGFFWRHFSLALVRMGDDPKTPVSHQIGIGPIHREDFSLFRCTHTGEIRVQSGDQVGAGDHRPAKEAEWLNSGLPLNETKFAAMTPAAETFEAGKHLCRLVGFIINATSLLGTQSAGNAGHIRGVPAGR